MEQLDASTPDAAGPVGPAAIGSDAVTHILLPEDVIAADDAGPAVIVAPMPVEPIVPDDSAAEPFLTSVLATGGPTLGDVRTGAYAQVLHEEPLQLVIAAMLHLDGLPGQYRPPAVQRSVDLLERAADRMRQLVLAMSVPDDRDTIPIVVQRAVDALLGDRGVRFEHSGDAGAPLSESADHAARSILVAALAEIRGRATVSTITLDLRTVDNAVVITLQDDGVGRLPPGPRPVLAPLADLRARAAAVGGTLDPGPGSVLTLTLPAEPGGSDPASS